MSRTSRTNLGARHDGSTRSTTSSGIVVRADGSVVVGGVALTPSLLARNPHLVASAGITTAPATKARAPAKARDVVSVRIERGAADGAADGAGGDHDAVTLHLEGLRLESSPNLREHGAVRGGRVARQRPIVEDALREAGTPVPVPCVVTIVRFGPRAMDSDSVVTACKNVRDAVAAWLLPVRHRNGRIVGNDGPSAPIDWLYDGVVRKTWGVRVTIRHDETVRLRTEARHKGRTSAQDTNRSGRGQGEV